MKRDKKDIENEGDVGYVRCCIARRGGKEKQERFVLKEDDQNLFHC